MAYRLEKNVVFVTGDWSLFEEGLQCYDTIGDANLENDWDELLYLRSAFEFVRDDLNDAQRAELDVVDAWWRDHAVLFNASFALEHNRKVIDTELQGFVWDEASNTPPIPRSHWWWWPIQGAGQ